MSFQQTELFIPPLILIFYSLIEYWFLSDKKTAYRPTDWIIHSSIDSLIEYWFLSDKKKAGVPPPVPDHPPPRMPATEYLQPSKTTSSCGTQVNLNIEHRMLTLSKCCARLQSGGKSFILCYIDLRKKYIKTTNEKKEVLIIF